MTKPYHPQKYPPFELISASFGEYVQEFIDQDIRLIVGGTPEPDETPKQWESLKRNMGKINRIMGVGEIFVSQVEGFKEKSLGDTKNRIVACNVVAEAGYRSYLEKKREINQRLMENDIWDPDEDLREISAWLIETVGKRRVIEICELVADQTLVTSAAKTMIRELGIVRDLTDTLYVGERYYRDERIEQFGYWRDDYQEHLPGKYLDAGRYEALSQTERDALADHLAYKLDFETFWELREQARTTGETDAIQPRLAGLALNHFGAETVADITTQIERVDVEGIDIDETVLDSDLEPVAPQLINGEWPDWDLPVLPAYIRETRGTDEHDPLTTAEARRLSPEAVASRMDIDQREGRECSVARVTRIEPSADAMLVIDLLRGSARWVDLPDGSQVRADMLAGEMQGALLLIALEGGHVESLSTVEPPERERRWELLGLERLTDTTLTFYHDRSWMPPIAEAAAKRSDEGSRGIASTFLQEESDAGVEVHVPPLSEDPERLFTEFLTGQRVLESHFDKLETADVPAHDIIVALPADHSYVALVCFGPDSVVLEDFHENFQAANGE